MSRYDVVVIGGGTNGMTCAALLARSGRKVALAEAGDTLGGLLAPWEFHQGYRVPGLLHDTTNVRDSVIDALDLKTHGLTRASTRPDIAALGSGQPLMIPGDREAAAHRLGADGDRYLDYREFIDLISGVVSTFLNEPPVNLVDVESLPLWALFKRAMRMRSLGKKTMLELLRIPPMAVADWLNEWFTGDTLKAALCLPAVAGTWCGPWSPGTSLNLLLWETAAAGAVTGLPEALEKAARAAGVEIRTNSRVCRIEADQAVKGVQLQDGEVIQADTVVSSVDPRQTFLDLVPAGRIPFRLENRIANYRMRGTTAQLVLALNSPFEVAELGTVEYARTGGHLDDVERAFDAVKYRNYSVRPILDLHVPTISQPSLAPEGHSVVNIHIHFAPYDLEGGWTDAARSGLQKAALDVLRQHVPDIDAQIVGSRLLTPVDIESRYGLTQGHIHHGEHALDQLLIRPAPEASTYDTPLPGLYLCGSGSHPGGGVSCAPGWLASQAIAPTA